MSLEIIACDQNSDEWRLARVGIPTASMFHTVLAKGKDGGASVTRKTYMLKLAGEIITGEPMENYTNKDMERGHEQEETARDLYSFTHDESVQRVGFIRNGSKGASPDSLVGDKGMLELKSNSPHVLIENIMRGTCPPEHFAQVQGGMWVCEREWCDFVSYWPKMNPFIVRVYRDDQYIANLSKAVDQFNEELARVVERVRAYSPS